MALSRFLVRASGVSSAHVACSSLGWGRTPLDRVHDDPGAFAAAIELPPGLHEYKFLLDDAWAHDPRCALARPDGFGGLNSVRLVSSIPPRPPESLRVLSLNLHTHQEPEPLRKLEQIALVSAALAVDLLLLQEVAAHLFDPSLPNAGEVLLGHLRRLDPRPWHHAWREAHVGFDVFREGLSILAPCPLLDVTSLQLSGGGLARIALLATLHHPRPLMVGTLHTTWAPSGTAEIEALLAGLGPGGSGPPVLLAGDLNGAPSAPHVQRLLAAGFQDHGAQHQQRDATFLDPPRERIDYQLTRPGASRLRCLGQWRLWGGDDGLGRVSDHAGLLGDFAWAS